VSRELFCTKLRNRLLYGSRSLISEKTLQENTMHEQISGTFLSDRAKSVFPPYNSAHHSLKSPQYHIAISASCLWGTTSYTCDVFRNSIHCLQLPRKAFKTDKSYQTYTHFHQEETTRPYCHKNALAARTKVPTLQHQQTTTL
jgi:hypothetical protein